MVTAVKKPEPLLQPIHASLVDRLEAGHAAAREAWASSARDMLDALFDEVIKGVGRLEQRIPEVGSEEDVLRVRAELAEFLRGAAAAIAPRSA